MIMDTHMLVLMYRLVVENDPRPLVSTGRALLSWGNFGR